MAYGFVVFSGFVGLRFDIFRKNKAKSQCLNSVKNHIRIIWEIVEGPSEIYPKSLQNRPKTIPNRWTCILGTFSAPNRAEVSSMEASSGKGSARKNTFWLKLSPQGRFLDPWQIGNRSKIALLRIEGHLDPPKMASGRGFAKNVKIEWTIDATSLLFDGAEPRLALYSSLFHTFAIFEKVGKINAKRDAQSHDFRRRASPPHPSDTSHLKQSSWKRDAGKN